MNKSNSNLTGYFNIVVLVIFRIYVLERLFRIVLIVIDYNLHSVYITMILFRNESCKQKPTGGNNDVKLHKSSTR